MTADRSTGSAARELRAAWDEMIASLERARDAIDQPELMPPPGTARNLAEGYRYLARIARVIRDSKAGIVGLQEIGSKAMAKELGRLAGMPFVFGRSKEKDSQYGDAILCRYPFTYVGNESIPSARRRLVSAGMTFASVVMAGGIVTPSSATRSAKLSTSPLSTPTT